MSKTVGKNNDKTPEDIQEYWTKERRDKAKPKPLPEVPDQETDGDRPSPKKPIITPPHTSKNHKNRDLEVSEGLAILVADPASFPWRCNGKLYFTWKGEDWVGSAGSILLEVLLTAGHNKYDEGEWSDDFMYWPGYPEYDKEPKSFGWSRVSIFTAWMEDRNFAFDYAMIHTDEPLTGIGSMGVIRNLSPEGKTWTAIGYPAEPPYGGEQMYKTTGKYVSGTSIITMDNNDMTRGSSGGNWWYKLGKDQTYINGVQSHRGAETSYAKSPYIDDEDYSLLLSCVAFDTCH